MKHKKYIIFIILVLVQIQFVQGQYIRMQGNQFIDEHGTKFYPMVMNYYIETAYESTPATINNSYINRASDGLGDHGHFCCGDIHNGLFNIEQDFREMINLGYNSIRLIYKPTKREGQSGYEERIESFPNGQDHQYIIINPPYNPATNPELAWYLNNLLDVINLANSLNLKVICPLTEDSHTTLMDSYQDDLNNYIAAVTNFMNQNNVRNILAYEFIGEPTYAVDYDEPETRNTKCNICRITDRWIQTVESNDPGRLTTIGSVHFDDPFFHGWDPNFLNVDFVNVHYYPSRKEDEYSSNVAQSLENSIQRFLNVFYTYDKFIRKPYIIGETAFVGEDGIAFPNVEGSEAEQAYFIEKTVPFIEKRTQAAGYGWWLLNNYHWGDAARWGILRFGNPDPSDINNGWAAHRKDVAQSFMDYRDGNLPVDNSYNFGPVSNTFDLNDMYYNRSSMTANSYIYTDGNGKKHYGYVKGHIYDQNGSPIEGAIIRGANFDGVGHLNSVSSISDANGYFEIYIDDTRPGDNAGSDPNMDKVFHDIKISAFGAIPIERGWGGGSIKGYEVYTLQSLSYKLDESKSISGINVPTGSTSNYQANSELIVSSANIQGNANFKASDVVELRNGFDAKPGSEVYIYNAYYKVSCDDIESIENNAGLKSAKSIVTNDEAIMKNDVNFVIYPNPANNIFYIKCNYHNGEQYNITITDISGKIVHKESINDSYVTIDFSNQNKGIYFVCIKTNNFQQNEKIILH
jgi:hypothetical protein